MREAIAGLSEVRVLPLKTKYPQGSEKQLIHVVTGREVPRGKLPLDAGALVFNVSTAAAVYDAVALGKPLVERVTTVTCGVKEPSNLLLRVGVITSYSIHYTKLYEHHGDGLYAEIDAEHRNGGLRIRNQDSVERKRHHGAKRLKNDAWRANGVDVAHDFHIGAQRNNFV